MPNNKPSKPPEPESKNERAPDVPGSPLKAILSGLAVDIGGTAVLGVVLEQLYALTLKGQGMAGPDIDQAMQHIPAASTVGVASIVLGALMSVAGGYVCARIVMRDEYRVGGVMTGVSVLLGLALSSADDPSGITALLILCTAACNMLGVKYGAEQNRRLEALAPPPTDTPTS